MSCVFCFATSLKTNTFVASIVFFFKTIIVANFFPKKTFVDNYWDKNDVTNLSDKDTKYSVKGLVYTLKPKTMTDITKNPGKELK